MALCLYDAKLSDTSRPVVDRTALLAVKYLYLMIASGHFNLTPGSQTRELQEDTAQTGLG